MSAESINRRRKKPTRVPDSRVDALLAEPPSEVGFLLKWFHAGAKPEECSKELEESACGFLAALAEHQAIIPLLGLVLTHHVRNPGHYAGWLNLGWSLQIMATRDPKPLATIRLQKALQCFDRALSLGSSERTVVIRAWAGKAFVNAQLGRFEEGVRCSQEALELDRSDPNLWLLKSSLLGMAGRKGEAMKLIDEAYRAYVMAGRPEGLRHLFDDAVPPLNTPDPEKHLRRIQ